MVSTPSRQSISDSNVRRSIVGGGSHEAALMFEYDSLVRSFHASVRPGIVPCTYEPPSGICVTAATVSIRRYIWAFLESPGGNV